jgi:hypothetical protein
VPTDPYVPPDPADRPRQQQNLPPGIALPPATRWTPNRPGDLGPGQPHGRLFGTPGPNVGYAYTLAARVKDRFQIAQHEDFDDAFVVVAEIAAKRAALCGRAPVIGDVDVALSLLGYDGSADNQFIELRSQLVRAASHEYQRRRAVVDAVPERLLRLAPSEIHDQIDEWRASAGAHIGDDLRRQPSA